MESPLSKLALDHWYQVLMVAGLAAFLLAGAGMLKEFPTAATASIGIGVFFFGMGEWINHPLQTALMPRSVLYPAGLITSHPRKASFAGIFFDLVGLVLMGWGSYKLFS